MLTTEKEMSLEKGLSSDQAIFLAKQKKKKKVAPKPVPKQGGKKK